MTKYTTLATTPNEAVLGTQLVQRGDAGDQLHVRRGHETIARVVGAQRLVASEVPHQNADPGAGFQLYILRFFSVRVQQ